MLWFRIAECVVGEDAERLFGYSQRVGADVDRRERAAPPWRRDVPPGPQPPETAGITWTVESARSGVSSDA
jgi:hypothetical protein